MWFGIGNCLFTLQGFIDGKTSRLTRAETKWVDDKFRGVHDLFRDSFTVAIAEMNDEKNDSLRRSLVKLTEAESKRKFLAGGAKEPEDEVMMYCAVCGCRGTVDIPAENIVKVESNWLKMVEHAAARVEW